MLVICGYGSLIGRWPQADKNRADGDGMVDVPKESRHELKRPRGQEISSIHNTVEHVEVDIYIWLVVWNHGILFLHFFGYNVFHILGI